MGVCRLVLLENLSFFFDAGGSLLRNAVSRMGAQQTLFTMGSDGEALDT